jgi:hypothetical protein
MRYMPLLISAFVPTKLTDRERGPGDERFRDRATTRERIRRADTGCYETLIDWTLRHAQRHGQEDEVHHMLEDMRSDIQAAYKGNLHKINAGLSLVLTINITRYPIWFTLDQKKCRRAPG